MRQLTYSLLLLSSLFGCRKAIEPSPKQDLTLVYQQPTTVAANGAVRATLTNVYDSRCPSDVVCIVGGAAAVTVELTDAANTQKVAISLGVISQSVYTPDSAAVVLNQRPYWLRLLSVNPYPSTKSGNQVKTAFLRLRPR